MVYGLEKFREYFKNHTNQYVFIGGTACDIIMDEIGDSFRATKDLDIVLIIEALDASFGEDFWNFIEDGGYAHREKSTGEDQFYRFSNPKDSSFPKMIELFSKRQNSINFDFDQRLTPIHIDESIISLSALILNDDYYEILKNNNRIIADYSVIEIETVILFKIKAWIDMKERIEQGNHVDSRNLKKHKNDIFRLLANVTPSNRIYISESIMEDVHLFIEMISNDKPYIKNLGLRNSSFDQLMRILKDVYVKKM